MSFSNRLPLAEAAASFVGVLVVTASILTIGLSQGAAPRAPMLYTFVHVLFFVALFGWPASLALMLLLGRPMLDLLKRLMRPRLAALTFVLAAATVGAVLVLGIWNGIWGDSDQPMNFLVVGLLAGGAAAGVFLRMEKGRDERRRESRIA